MPPRLPLLTNTRSPLLRQTTLHNLRPPPSPSPSPSTPPLSSILQHHPSTSTYATHARPRPSPRTSNPNKPTTISGPKKPLYDDSHFPVEAFMAAQNARTIPLSTVQCRDLIKRYIALREESFPAHANVLEAQPVEEHGRVLCQEFSIPPSTLSFIAFILLRSTATPNPASSLTASPIPQTHPHNPLSKISKHLLDISSQLLDPSATIFLYRNTLSNPALNNKYLQRLATIAITTHDPSALYVYAGSLLPAKGTGVGEWLPPPPPPPQGGGRKGGRGEMEREREKREELRKKRDQAFQIYVKAGEGGIGMAYVKAAELLEEELQALSSTSSTTSTSTTPPDSDSPLTTLPTRIHDLYTKASALNVPEAHLRLALLLSPTPPTPPTSSPTTTTPTLTTPQTPYEHHLTAAAAAGNDTAMHLLHLHHLPTHPKLAKEWLMVAAHAGNVDAMRALSRWFSEREGKAELAREWEFAADERAIVLARKRRSGGAGGGGAGEETVPLGEGVVGL